MKDDYFDELSTIETFYPMFTNDDDDELLVYPPAWFDNPIPLVSGYWGNYKGSDERIYYNLMRLSWQHIKYINQNLRSSILKNLSNAIETVMREKYGNKFTSELVAREIVDFYNKSIEEEDE